MEMGRFDYLESEEAKKTATLAVDGLAAELERFHRNQWFGRILVAVDVRHGAPSQVTVTPEYRVRSSDFSSGD